MKNFSPYVWYLTQAIKVLTFIEWQLRTTATEFDALKLVERFEAQSLNFELDELVSRSSTGRPSVDDLHNTDLATGQRGNSSTVKITISIVEFERPHLCTVGKIRDGRETGCRFVCYGTEMPIDKRRKGNDTDMILFHSWPTYVHTFLRSQTRPKFLWSY